MPPVRPHDLGMHERHKYPYNLVRAVHGEKGGIKMYRPCAGVVLSEAWGHMDEMCANAYTIVGTTMFQDRSHGGEGGFWIFNDWSEMKSYTSSARHDLTKWGLKTFERGDHAVFILQSKIVAMGVSTASMAFAFAGIDISIRKTEQEFTTTLKESIASKMR